jgi:hypothetical protein
VAAFSRRTAMSVRMSHGLSLQSIRSIYSDMDAWQERGRPTPPEQPQSGSLLSVDDSVYPWHPVSEAARLSLLVSGEHLRMAQPLGDRPCRFLDEALDSVHEVGELFSDHPRHGMRERHPEWRRPLGSHNLARPPLGSHHGSVAVPVRLPAASRRRVRGRHSTLRLGKEKLEAEAARLSLDRIGSDRDWMPKHPQHAGSRWHSTLLGEEDTGNRRILSEQMRFTALHSQSIRYK